MSQAAMGSFDEATVESLSSSLGEPDWLRSIRLDSFRKFASLPDERNPLYTKYSRLSAFDLGSFGVSAGASKVDFRSHFEGFLSGKESNILLQGNEAHVHTDLDTELSKSGVKLVPVHRVLETDEKLVRSLFEARRIKSESDKFAAFVNAFFNCGTVVSVPEGLALPTPLRRMVLLDGPASAVVDQSFVVAAEGSRLVFMEELYSKPGERSGLLASNTEVLTGRGAKVDFSSIQLLGSADVHVSNRAVQASADSRASVSTLALGSSVSRSRTNFFLEGRGSVAEGFEIFFTDGTQRYDFETNLLHLSPDSTGSTQARGVLKGSSQSIFKGMIKIVKAAKNSRSYLAHHAMILERTAKSDGIPGLEIDNNEVKATHSASVAQIDDEQLFYLAARGLSPDEAKKMVVMGFFEPVLSRVPIEQTREGARFMIEGKWEGVSRRVLDRETMLEATGEAVPQPAQREDLFERHYKYRQG